MMKKNKRFGLIFVFALITVTALAVFAGCDCGNAKKELKFETNAITVNVGQTIRLTPEYPDGYSDAVWTSKSESVATVDNDGNVSALSIGNAIIKVTVKVGEQTQSALCQVTVAKKGSVAMGQIVLSDTDIKIHAGESYAAGAYLQFGDAKISDVEWATSDAKICTVAGGVITGVSEGTANVGVSCNYGGIDYSADIAVTVAAKLQTIEIDLKNDYIVVGEEVQLNVFLVKDGTATKIDNNKVTYSVDNEDFATIGGSVLTGIGIGKIELTATAETEEIGTLSVTAPLDVLRYCTVKYTVEGKVVSIERVPNSKCAKAETETPFLDGYVFKEWTHGGDAFTANSVVNDDIEVEASWYKLTNGSGEYIKETILHKYIDGTGFVYDGNLGSCNDDGLFEVQMQTADKYDYSVTIPAFNFVRQGVTQFNIDVNYSGWTISLWSTPLVVTSTSSDGHSVFDFTVYATADGKARLVNGNVEMTLSAAQANGNEGITFKTTRPQGSTYAQFTISPMFLNVYDYRAMLESKASVLAGMTADSDKDEYFGYYVNYFDSLSSATPYEQKNLSVPSGVTQAKELLKGGEYTLIDFTSGTHGVSAKQDDGGAPFSITSGTNQLTIDPSGRAGMYTVYLPKIRYTAYNSVSFTYSVSSIWSGIGLDRNSLITTQGAGNLSGTITVTVNDGVATAVISDNSYGTRTVTLSDNVANGIEQMELFYDATAYHKLTISNFTAEI